MTSLVPNPPYSEARLRELYPPKLDLLQVQLFFRHGERAPITNGFQHLGLLPYWPLCGVAGKFNSVALIKPDSHEFGYLPWKRRLEAIRTDDGPMNLGAANGNSDDICLTYDPTLNASGELTDIGRHSMFSLGQRVRHLYVDQLGLMPKIIKDQDTLYIRASCWPRALVSTHQAFLGLFPLQYRVRGFTPEIVQRSPRDEALMPNKDYCVQFIDMMKAYSKRAAERWNQTKEMEYVNTLLQRHMPSEQRVAIDSIPRISQIYDAINSTLATEDSQIKLPSEFYDPIARRIINRFAYNEEFGPFYENAEYRTLGIGALLGDIVERMVQKIEAKFSNTGIRMAVYGGHDSTLIGILASLGTLDENSRIWPPYSSSIAMELFQTKQVELDRPASTRSISSTDTTGPAICRTSTAKLSNLQKQKMNGYYVRIRYNDQPMIIPGCKAAARHLEGDESFCTLAAFKETCDKISPQDIKKSCLSNLHEPAFPVQDEPAGF